jgi:hypothetical protein
VDEVSFERGGTEVHIRKESGNQQKTATQHIQKRMVRRLVIRLWPGVRAVELPDTRGARNRQASCFRYSRASGAQRSDAELAPDNRSHVGAEDFYGVQHFFVWQRRDTHLECDARNATENFIHVKDLFRDRFGVAD